MKFFSFLTLCALITISSCSHFYSSQCDKKSYATCTKEKCEKPCCDKDKKCNDGSCVKKEKKCSDESCHKKTK